MSPLVYAGFGTAAAGILVGSVTGFLTLSKTSTLRDACRDGRCPPSSQSDIDSASATGAVSTVAFVIGGVGLAAGVVGILVRGSSTETPRASGSAHARQAPSGIRVVPTVNGVVGSF